MKWLIAGFVSLALAILSLAIPAPVFSGKAEASRMDGKGNCAGGVCTQKMGMKKTKGGMKGKK